MMFIIFGLRSKTKPVVGGVQRHHFCSSCGQNRVFHEAHRKDYVSFYFVPLIPVSAGDPVMSCTVCGSNYQMKENEIPHAAVEQALPTKITVQCDHCHGKMKVPKTDKALMATCPHCQKKFQIG
jgi:transcription elongation factor Elf1